MDWERTKVLLTGGSGFVGRHVALLLKARGCRSVVVPRSRTYDLRQERVCHEILGRVQPDLVIHLAAVVGGIGANRSHPGQFFHDNLAMGLHMIEAARKFGTPKFVCVGTICAYPRIVPVPFQEETLWDGYPEETNAPYAIAKKALLVMLQAYRQEYRMNGIYLLPTNIYGPHDNFDLATSHVIPAMIRKFAEAKDADADHVTLWGTGAPTRDFLFVRDAAEAILAAAAAYDKPDPVNLGSGLEVSIRSLAEDVRTAIGFEGHILWDPTKPDGQPRRGLDTSRAEREFGWKAQTTFEDGLSQTVAWYLKERGTWSDRSSR